MATDRAITSTRGPQVAIPRHFGSLEVVRVNTRNWEATFRVRTSDGLFGPEFTTRLSMIQPLSDEDTRQFWEMLVDDLLARFKADGEFPDFVRGYELTLGDDSTGDPALYVKILVKPARGVADDATVARWNEFANQVQDALLQLRLQRWPYVQLGEWRRRR